MGVPNVGDLCGALRRVQTVQSDHRNLLEKDHQEEDQTAVKVEPSFSFTFLFLLTF